MLRYSYLLCFFAFFTLILSCKKDSVNQLQDSKQTVSQSRDVSMTVEKAKSLFYVNAPELLESSSPFLEKHISNGCVDFIPIWKFARQIKTKEGSELVTVPIEMPKELATVDKGIQLVFYGNSDCVAPIEMVFYKREMSGQETLLFDTTFTGAVASFNFCDGSSETYPILEGKIFAPITNDFYAFGRCNAIQERNDQEVTPWCGPEPGCFDDWGGGSNGFWQGVGNFFSGIGNWIGGIFSGNGSGGSSSGNTGGNSSGWSGGFPFYGGNEFSSGGSHPTNGSGSSGSGGGGSGSTIEINSIFDGNFFNGEGQYVMNLLEEIIAENDLFVCTEDFHTTIYECMATTAQGLDLLPHPHDDPNATEFTLQSYQWFLQGNNSEPAMNQCVSNAISQYSSDLSMDAGQGMMVCFIQEHNNFDISDQNLFSLIAESDCYQNSVEDGSCMNEMYQCLANLDDLQEQYGIQFNQSILQQLVFETNSEHCDSEDFKEQLFELYLYQHGFTDDWLVQNEIDWLTSNFNTSIELISFLNAHSASQNQTNQTKAVLKAYLSGLMNPSSELAQLIEDFENASIGDPLWEILKDQLAEALTALIADLIPGGTIITIGPELLDNLSQGNFLDALWNAVDIALNEADTFIPAAKVASFSINLVVIVDKMADFYKVLDKMKERLPDQVVYKLYLALRNKVDDLYSNFSWGGWGGSNSGATVTGIGDPLDFWDELLDVFGAGNIGDGNGNEITAEFFIGGYQGKLKFYPSSTTPPHCPTIEIEVANATFKFRLC